MRGIDQLVELCYGNSVTERTEKEARLVIRLLGANGELSREELIRELSLEDDYANPGKKLDDILSPLRGNKGELGIEILVSESRDGGTYYSLSIHALNASFNSLRENVKYIMESESLQTEIPNLQREVRNLRK